jgi:hypothetical protein
VDSSSSLSVIPTPPNRSRLQSTSSPTTARPWVVRSSTESSAPSSTHSKELRPGSAGETEVRILFIFDPERQAVLLVSGDKSGQWTDWYVDNIEVAEERYARWLAGDYDEEI